MSLEKYLTLLKSLDFYIRRKATGDANIFAKRIGTSKRSLLRHLKDLKEFGFPIKYDKKRRSYIYTEEGNLTKNLFSKEQELTKKEQGKITGGYTFLDISIVTSSDTFNFELYPKLKGNSYPLQCKIN